MQACQEFHTARPQLLHAREEPPKPDDKDDGSTEKKTFAKTFASRCLDLAYVGAIYWITYSLVVSAYYYHTAPRFREELRLYMIKIREREIELQNDVEHAKERAEREGEHSHYLVPKRDELGNVQEGEVEVSVLTRGELVADLERSLERVKASQMELEKAYRLLESPFITLLMCLWRNETPALMT
jgi:hypothetical protein